MAKRRRGPSTPAEIHARALAAQQAAKAAADRRELEQLELEARRRRDPGEWGLDAAVVKAGDKGDLVVRRAGKRVTAARRVDPFDQLLAHGGLGREEHGAAQRLITLFLAAGGVVDRNPLAAGGAANDGAAEMVCQAMVDASRQLQWVLRAAGPSSGRLLEAVLGAMCMPHAWLDWRGVVQATTGERDPKAQASRIRQACADVLAAFEGWDREGPARRAARRAALDAGAALLAG